MEEAEFEEYVHSVSMQKKKEWREFSSEAWVFWEALPEDFS